MQYDWLKLLLNYQSVTIRLSSNAVDDNLKSITVLNPISRHDHLAAGPAGRHQEDQPGDVHEVAGIKH